MRKIIDSMRVVESEQQNEATVVSRPSGPTKATKAAGTTTTTTTTTKKKCWSRAAKGAVIGAGVGAITEALICKKGRELSLAD